MAVVMIRIFHLPRRKYRRHKLTGYRRHKLERYRRHKGSTSWIPITCHRILWNVVARYNRARIKAPDNYNWHGNGVYRHFNSRCESNSRCYGREMSHRRKREKIISAGDAILSSVMADGRSNFIATFSSLAPLTMRSRGDYGRCEVVRQPLCFYFIGAGRGRPLGLA